jgi:hypothetical protein
LVELIPLSSVPDFTEDIRQKLAPFWVDTVQEFVDLARSPNRTFGSGLAALSEDLQLPAESVEALFYAAQAALPEGSSFDVLSELVVGDGAILDGLEDLEASSFDLPTEDLPAEVNLIGSLPPPRNQGHRNSCVAFTLAAMVQQQIERQLGQTGEPLSPQFIYWACKQRDGIPGDRGTSPLLAMQLLQEAGVCRDVTWPYNPNVDDQNPGHGPAAPEALEEARRYRISGFDVIQPKSVLQIKAQLAAGRSVLLGLYIFEHWTGTSQVRRLGKLRRPLTGEGNRGGHAMLAVGYRDDPQVDGGGYLIVRNSWGTDFATENPDGAGYLWVPYTIIFERNLAAFAISGLALAS